MKLILIGNYPPDGQESMQRFTQMLADGFRKEGHSVHCWYPKPFVGKLFSTTLSGAGKWAGYVDKWLLFPLYLKMRSFLWYKKDVRFHICDHSNAPYLQSLPKQKTVITCHDVIAIRAGLGYAGTHVTTSRTGKWLQKWILSHLNRAPAVAAVSRLTLDQLTELRNGTESQSNWQVIHNGFNALFSPSSAEAAAEALEKVGIANGEKYILHVGSDLPRKNRKLLLEMAAQLGEAWKGKICFAGKALEPALWQRAKELNLKDRVISVVKPDHDTLQALYSRCEAFIFPSFSEGFGWPVIEAQACGAPVIASSIEPMPEIGGEGAIFADPAKPETFAAAFLDLKKGDNRNAMIKKGFQNVRRFHPLVMTKAYLKLHGLAVYDPQNH